jgi:sRNA-binding protein
VFTRKSLSGFLHRYTTGTPYLLALTRQEQRFDLDGQPAGELAAEHREAAATELTRRRGIVEARRAAENTAKREAEAAARQQQQASHQADQQARRDRAQLLRAFETSPLTPANFCALKGITGAELEPLLAHARAEAAERPVLTPEPAHQPRPRAGPRTGPRPGPRNSPRPPR